MKSVDGSRTLQFPKASCPVYSLWFLWQGCPFKVNQPKTDALFFRYLGIGRIGTRFSACAPFCCDLPLGAPSPKGGDAPQHIQLKAGVRVRSPSPRAAHQGSDCSVGASWGFWDAMNVAWGPCDLQCDKPRRPKGTNQRTTDSAEFRIFPWVVLMPGEGPAGQRGVGVGLVEDHAAGFP